MKRGKEWGGRKGRVALIPSLRHLLASLAPFLPLRYATLRVGRCARRIEYNERSLERGPLPLSSLHSLHSLTPVGHSFRFAPLSMPGSLRLASLRYAHHSLR